MPAACITLTSQKWLGVSTVKMLMPTAEMTFRQGKLTVQWRKQVRYSQVRKECPNIVNIIGHSCSYQSKKAEFDWSGLIRSWLAQKLNFFLIRQLPGLPGLFCHPWRTLHERDNFPTKDTLLDPFLIMYNRSSLLTSKKKTPFQRRTE